ncbi:hypothetical protein HY993_03390 [Candidatus Micrarchaeota archaeon]|nr:hypothetical protein [Candidatus Micrarchaeota archaeon]
MKEFWEEMDELASVNSEVRYLTVELMKIAAGEKKSFSQVNREFLQNAVELKKSLLSAGKKKKQP